ncbi:MAG: hypothetical protein IBX71_00560 [Candidatus Desulforudis sp.]|nr:hypothetical protein [Desulforudis sp.]
MASVVLAAVGCGQMEEAWRIVTRHPIVVFGTLDEAALSRLVRLCRRDWCGVPVYFYQSG